MKTARFLFIAALLTISGISNVFAGNTTKIAASDAEADDYFGASVSIDGDYAIVGAYQEDAGGADAGAAYIYLRTADNTWDAGTKIVAADQEAGDGFGYSVSIDGDYAIVGAYQEDAGGTDAGAAYIFYRTGENTWGTGTKIVAPDPADYDYFGSSVSISGDYAIVGADHEDAGGDAAGAAYIFHRTDTNTWDTGTKIVASDAQDDDFFGKSVGISGDYAIAGAYGEDAGGSYAGAAYIFHRTDTNTWDAGTKIAASDPEVNDYFGKSVSISGDYAIVGASEEDTAGTDAGAAYIFHRTDTNTWDAGTKIVASDPEAEDRFGNSVFLSGDDAIVGAFNEDTGGTDAGSAYVFHRTGVATWDTGSKIMSSDHTNGDNFGFSVSISGDFALVGADQEDYNAISNAGSAYVFQYETSGADKLLASDGETGDNFGKSVSLSGDYAIVGAHNEDSGGLNAGAAYIIHRTDTNTWDEGTKVVAPDAEANDLFGYSVAISGDYAIVGAYGEDTGGDGSGSVYFFHRTDTNTWDAGTKLVAPDAETGDRFGYSVALSGDYAIVGAYSESAGGSSAGAAYIFHRTDTTTWDTGTKIMASDEEASDYFGNSVSLSGYYAIVGAYNEDTGGTWAGAAYIYYRTDTNTWDGGTKIMASDAEAFDFYGYSVALSGPYAIVGAYAEDAGGSTAGAAYLYNRTDTNTWSAGTKVTASDAAFNDNYGYSVAIYGYYALVGAWREDSGWSTAGGSTYAFQHGLPTAIDVLAFEADWAENGAVLYWITGAETECGAFTLLRCELGEPWDDAEPNCPLNEHTELDIVIPCEDSPYGAEYEAFDVAADSGAGYSYLLREYDTTGGVSDFGPVLLVSNQYGAEWPGEALSDDDEENPGDPSSVSEPATDDDDQSNEAAAESEDAEEEEDAGCGI